MRILGLDLGNKTCGVAISDPTGLITRGITTIRFKSRDFDTALAEVVKIVNQEKAEKIVLGLPKNMNGTIGYQAEYCLEFKKMIEVATKLEVIMIDERLTSKEVDVIMLQADLSRKKRKQNVDKLAATIILQTYLDQKR